MRYINVCSKIIQAIANPNSDIELKAWRVIMPNIIKLDSYYNSSMELSNIFRQMLIHLIDNADVPIIDNINSLKATTKHLWDILKIAYDFDQSMISMSQIQNDFSYYKRVLSRIKSSPQVCIHTLYLFSTKTPPVFSSISNT